MFEKRVENFKLLETQNEKILAAANLIKEALNNGNKVLFCGNGGSGADSNHLAAEFIARFQKNRKSYAALSLCSNNSVITAVANDYSYEDIFTRQIEGIGCSNDILIALSTSAKSKNVLKAIDYSLNHGIKVVLLTGINKTNLPVDIEINTPSNITCEIQEMHMAVGHTLCELLESFDFSH